MDTVAEVLGAASADVTRSLDLPSMLEKLLERLALLVPYGTASILTLDDGGRLVLRARRGYDQRGEPAMALDTLSDAPAHPLFAALGADRRSILIPDTQAHPGWPGDEGTEHVRSVIGVPLVESEQVIGLLAVDKAEPGFFTAGHLQLTEALAPSVAVAIRKARLLEHLQKSDERLQQQLGEFQTLLDVLPIGIGIARDPDCRFVAANGHLVRQLGVSPGANTSFTEPCDELRGVQLVHEGRPLPPAEMPMQRAATSGREVAGMEMDVVRDGRTVATIVGYASPLFDQAGRPRGAIGASLEVTERKRAEAHARNLAYHDSVTDLPNRRLFQDRLALAVAQAHRHRKPLAVLFLDLDRFKVINDSLGHSVGDRLIHELSTRLRTCLREGDTVARLGGDEFTLLLPDIGQLVDAAKVAAKVLDLVRRPFHIDGRELFVTGSLGISVYPDDGKDAETLVKNAETAMYRAKEQARDHYQLYTPAMNATALQRLALESSLRKAMSQDELVLYYQPMLDRAGRVRGAEALLRWRHPEMGLVAPAEFIPLAELTGLILPMGPWVLRSACAQAWIWQERYPGLSVAVNLSPRQFQAPGLVGQVTDALADTGLDPGLLELEITESNAMQNAPAAIETLRELKGLGVRLSIDDFGTGYSSLSYLRRFPIDTLKIDQSFIRDVADDADGAAITSAVIALAHTLKLEVVAEGVETRGQLDFLAASGCDRMQGYLFSPPVPADGYEELMAAAAEAS